MQAPLPPHFVRSPLPAIARRDEACASMNGSQHAERVQVGLENGLLLLALVDVLLAQPHHSAQRLDVETVALGLGKDVANVVGDRLLLFFEPLDAFDERLELILGEAVGGLLVLDGSSGGDIGHRALLATRGSRLVGSAGAQVKARGRSSTALHSPHPTLPRSRGRKIIESSPARGGGMGGGGATSMFMACFFQCRLLIGGNLFLVL